MTIALLYMLNNKDNIVPSIPQIFAQFAKNRGYSIYVHLTVPELTNQNFLKPLNFLKLPKEDIERITIIPTIPTSYGTYSITQVMINLLETAITKIDNTHFIFLSETCVPLYNPEIIKNFIETNWIGKSWFNKNPHDFFYNDKETLNDIYKLGWYRENALKNVFLQKNKLIIDYGEYSLISGKLFLAQIKQNDKETEQIFHNVSQFPDLHKELSNLVAKHDQLGKYLSMFKEEINSSNPNQLDFTIPRSIYKNGRQQCMISRDHVLTILKNMDSFIPYFKKQKFASDENFFITVLGGTITKKEFDSKVILVSGINYARFEGQSSASILNVPVEYNNLLSLKALFMRKVLFSEETLNILQEKFYSRSYNDLLSVFNKN